MGLLKKLRNSFSKHALGQDSNDELAWHLEQRTQDFINQGMSPEQARSEARKRLGNLTALNEETFESDLLVSLESIKRELLLAIRMLRRAPIVTAVAVLSLGLGIGANTVVFTLMKQVVLDYLPVPHSDRLVILHSQSPDMGWVTDNGMHSSFSYPLYRDLNAGTSKVFDGILAFLSVQVSLSGGSNTETISGDVVSGNFFSVLEVTPWRGRLLSPSDDQTVGANPVAVISYGLWQRKFAADSAIVNRTVLINKHRYIIVGVAPPQFYGVDVTSRADLYLPMSMKDDVMPDGTSLDDRLAHWCGLLGRLKPGIGMERANSALGAIYPPLRDQDLASIKNPPADFKKAFSNKRIQLSEGGQGYSGLRENLTNPLRILMAMVGIVLLIAVVNVANLLVARGVSRQREMAIRLSVGAGKVVLARQLLIESLVLALMGGCLGLAIAYAGTPALLHLLSFDLSTASISAQPDTSVLLLSAAVTLLAGIAFGLLPAWQSARTNVASVLKTEGGHGHTGAAVWLRRALVVAQVALSLVLVTSAILFTRSLRNLQHINVGFDTAHLVKFKINPLQAGYSQTRIKSLGEDLRRRLMLLPGVESAAVATVSILDGNSVGGDVTVEGASKTSQAGSDNSYTSNVVSPGFFTTMQIPLLSGRQFTASDSLPTSKVALVNKTFVARYLSGRNPLGVHFGFGSGDVKFVWTIIGVVADSEHADIRSKIEPFVYMPYLAREYLSELCFYVRLRSTEAPILPEIRNLVHQLDADLPVNRLSTMTDLLNEQLFVERSLGFLSIAFAVLATLLAVVGLYGVMSYSVTSRARELAIRMAIGASPQSLLMMVLRESALLGIFGTLCAVPFVLITMNYVRSVLYGVEPNDPLVWIAAIAFLVAIAIMAGLFPARTAARMDPQAALRAD